MPHANYFPLLAFAIALSAVWWLSRGRAMQLVLDRPNDRSLHQQPVPRTGGLGMHAAILLVCPFAAPGVPTVVWLIFPGLLAVSFLDDLYGLPALARLTAHLAGSGIFAAIVVYPAQGLTTACIAVLGVAWLVNLYNFMDGADGLAGGMTLFGFGFYGAAAWLAGQPEFAIMNFSVAATAAAFLLFNFHPARIFLGDAGSVPLGFLAGAMGLLGWQLRLWTWWFPLLVFSPFVVDASVTLVRRAFARARVWEAHRDHYYQRLVRMGHGHRNTALMEYALMAACGFAALAGVRWSLSSQIALICLFALLYTAIIIAVERAWRRHEAEQVSET